MWIGLCHLLPCQSLDIFNDWLQIVSFLVLTGARELASVKESVRIAVYDHWMKRRQKLGEFS